MNPSVPLVTVRGTALQMLRELEAEVSDLYRALANNPPILEAWIGLAWGLREHAVTPRAMRELMILRSAQIHNADYQWKDHETMALEAGVSQGQIDMLEDWKGSSLFDEPTAVALQFTEEVIAGRVNESTLEVLAEHFDPAQRIELIATASFYCMVPRVLDALRLGGQT